MPSNAEIATSKLASHKEKELKKWCYLYLLWGVLVQAAIVVGILIVFICVNS